MLAAGTHPDFLLVYKELAAYHPDPRVRDRVMQELGIDVVRDFLIVPAGAAPARGRGKVFVVLEAELMSAPAQNCLLKTLEEPPRGVTIILITQRPEELLPTTLSRCSTVRFGPLPREFVMARLAEAGVEGPQAEFWAGFAAGSAGEALRLSQRGLYDAKREIVGRLGQMGDAGDPDLADELVKIADAMAAAAVKNARKDDSVEMSKNLATRQGVGTLLRIIASAFRDALHVRSAGRGRPARPLVHCDQQPAIEAIARRLGPAQLAEIIEQLAEYERLLWRNVSPKILWDNVVVTCASAAPLRL